MVQTKQPKNDVQKPICRVTERMKVGKSEATSGKEPSEHQVTVLRDINSCKIWIEQNGKCDHLYKIYKDDCLDCRLHFHKGHWMKALREPEGTRLRLE